MLREAHMTRFSKMFAAVSGAVAIGCWGLGFLSVARINAGEHV